MMSHSKTVLNMLANKQETPPSSSSDSEFDLLDGVQFLAELKEDDEPMTVKFITSDLRNTESGKVLQRNPNLETLIQQEFALSRIVSMAAEGQF